MKFHTRFLKRLTRYNSPLSNPPVKGESSLKKRYEIPPPLAGGG
jgi:hypothetical protein